ncbi:MAG: hypothetical protein C4337_06635, partial [Armatimonadota bacterium]
MYEWHGSHHVPFGVHRASLNAGYWENNALVPQVVQQWEFSEQPPHGDRNRSRNLERELYASIYGEVPANCWGRLFRRQWGDAFATLDDYRLTAECVETEVTREHMSGDFVLLRHRDDDQDKKFNWVEIERPRFDFAITRVVSRERVWLSAQNGKPVKRQYFDFRSSNTPTWEEQYAYEFGAYPQGITGYVNYPTAKAGGLPSPGKPGRASGPVD